MGIPPTLARPTLEIDELYTAYGLRLYPVGNLYTGPLRNRGPYQNYSTLLPRSLVYGSEAIIGDYAGLIANWVTATNTGFPYDTSFLSPNFNAWQAGGFNSAGAQQYYPVGQFQNALSQ